MKTVKELDHCTVVSDKKLKGSGLGKGDIVMVIGTTSVQDKASDPYLKRTYVSVIKVENGVHLMPTADPDDPRKAILMDPRKLEVVSDEAHEMLNSLLTEQFS